MGNPALVCAAVAYEIFFAEGLVPQAMPKCDQLDLWLSTHLTDILDKVNAIEADPEQVVELRTQSKTD